MTNKSPITTHVLDTHRGNPAVGISVTLEKHFRDSDWKTLSKKQTDGDGRITDFLPATDSITKGLYRLTFDTRPYFKGLKEIAFFPSITICFEIEDTNRHTHVPLLMSGHGYSTYRGS